MYNKIDGGIKKVLNSYELIIPRHDNDGKFFSDDIIDRITKKILSFFGGMTLINCLGYWANGEQTFKDENIKIIIDSDTDKSKELLSLKKELAILLKQEKIYLVQIRYKEEILSVQEFLDELGIESKNIKNICEESPFLDKIVEKQNELFKRTGYKTTAIHRKKGKIYWEREIAGIRFKSEFEDVYDKNSIILSTDTLEKAFTDDNIGKPIIVIGDYESQRYILDKSKRRHLVDLSEKKFIDTKGAYYHPWFGELTPKEFASFFIDQIIVNYILLRELSINSNEIEINIGSDGGMLHSKKELLMCPATIVDKNLQKYLIDCVRIGITTFENNTIDELALKQAKVLNRYSEKIAMLKSGMCRIKS